MQGISGSTADCLADFATRYPVPQAASLLAEFASVDSPTAVDWLKGIYFPKGSNLLAVRCFLALCDYEVTEHEAHTGPARQLGQLISFGIITKADVQAAMSFQNANGVFHVTLRNKGLMPHRQHVMMRLITENISDLVVAIKEWRTKVEQLEELVSSDVSAIMPDPEDEPAIPAPYEVLAPDPKSSDTHSGLQTSEPTSSKRIRVRTSKPAQVTAPVTSSDLSTARILSLLVHAIDEALVVVHDPDELAKLFFERVSHKKVRTAQQFLYKVIKLG